MSASNKITLEKANAAITKGDYEGFLKYCTEDTEWNFVGDTLLYGKQAVREWMAANYTEPPVFKVAQLVEEDDFVIAMGHIIVKDKAGKKEWHNYCDVWQFRDGKMAALKAFVIQPAAGADSNIGSLQFTQHIE